MFNASAEYYDLIYAPFKDYASDVAQIASLLRRLNPRCRTVLDGEHDSDGLTGRGLFIARSAQ